MIDDRRHEDLVHRYLIERTARADPMRVAVRFPLESIEWSWACMQRESEAAAQHLRSIGVERGDVVALMGRAGSEYLRFFLGALWLGAIVAPLNPAYRGSILAHVLRLAQPRALMIDDGLRPRLDLVELDGTVTVVDISPAPPPTSPSTHPRDAMPSPQPASNDPVGQPIDDPGLHYWDPYAVIFTSGTTGPTKGVLSPYGQIEAVVRDNLLTWVGPEDVLMLDAPIFHISGLLMVYASLSTGAALVVYPKFSGSEFWDRVRRHRVTVSTVVGPEMLLQAPERPDDRNNPLRVVLTGRHSPEWRRRFAVHRAFTFYNMSEISSPLQLPPHPINLLSVGLPRPGVEVRVVDEHDIEVAAGGVGELIVRTDRPWEMNLGYLNNTAATASAWRNGWFHTGDAFKIDAESGEYLFIDRLKDCVRRRGENISSYEVECEVLGHHAVAECAVVAVAGDVRDDEEVKAVIVVRPGIELDPADLVSFLEPRLPAFMIPRFIEIVDDLPRTETSKVRKVELRIEGVNEHTWDRHEHRTTHGGQP